MVQFLLPVYWEGSKLKKIEMIQITQFLLTLAWTCTEHKVQGLTLPEVVFSFQSYLDGSTMDLMF